MGPIQTLDDLLSMLRRHRILIGVVVVVGAVLSVAHALRQPHLYEAAAVLQVQAPKIADTLAPTTVEAPTARQIQAVEQQMMARDNLFRLAEQFGLLEGMHGLTAVDKLQILREMIQIRPIAAVRSASADDSTVSGVTIIARAYSPQQVLDLTNALADQIIGLIREARLERTETTMAFFTERVAVVTAEIAEMEARITALKNESDLTLDGSIEFRRIEISTLQRAILDIERERLTLQGALDKLMAEPQLRVVQRRIDELRAELDVYDDQKAALAARSAALALTIEQVPEAQNRLDVLEGQLERLEEQRSLALQNLSNAETANRLERADQAERLSVIEPPVLPDYPVAPSRKKIAAAGVMGSGALALLLAFLLDLRRPVIRSAAQMERELGIRPVVTVPYLASPYEASRAQDRLRYSAMGAAGAVGLMALVALVFL